MKLHYTSHNMRFLYASLLFVGLSATAPAQDLHYSQFYLNPMHLTPASTGVFKGDLRVAALYRSQWKNVPVAYETFSGAVEWKALERQNNTVSVGFLLQNDQAGDAGLSWLQLGASVGVARALNENHSISVGLGLNFVQRSFDINALTFKNQWNGDAFDPGLSSGESFNKTSGLAPALTTGLQWHFEQTDSRTQADIGWGMAHINRPLVSLGDFDVMLPRRISFYGNLISQLNARHDLVLCAEWQQMAKARELVFGAGIRRILTTGLANSTVLQLTLSHRFHDAIIPALQVERNNWTLGLSYDWNTSDFDMATRGHGGIEIAVIWRRIPVPAVKTVKSCPIF